MNLVGVSDKGNLVAIDVTFDDNGKITTEYTSKDNGITELLDSEITFKQALIEMKRMLSDEKLGL